MVCSPALAPQHHFPSFALVFFEHCFNFGVAFCLVVALPPEVPYQGNTYPAVVVKAQPLV